MDDERRSTPVLWGADLARIARMAAAGNPGQVIADWFNTTPAGLAAALREARESGRRARRRAGEYAEHPEEANTWDKDAVEPADLVAERIDRNGSEETDPKRDKPRGALGPAPPEMERAAAATSMWEDRRSAEHRGEKATWREWSPHQRLTALRARAAGYTYEEAAAAAAGVDRPKLGGADVTRMVDLLRRRRREGAVPPVIAGLLDTKKRRQIPVKDGDGDRWETETDERAETPNEDLIKLAATEVWPEDLLKVQQRQKIGWRALGIVQRVQALRALAKGSSYTRAAEKAAEHGPARASARDMQRMLQYLRARAKRGQLPPRFADLVNGPTE